MSLPWRLWAGRVQGAGPMWQAGRRMPGGGGSGGQVAAEPGEDLLPAVDGGFGTVGGAVHREERGAGAFVGVELGGLALCLQLRFELVDLLGRGVLVVRAEQAEQRAGQVLGQVLD